MINPRRRSLEIIPLTRRAGGNTSYSRNAYSSAEWSACTDTSARNADFSRMREPPCVLPPMPEGADARFGRRLYQIFHHGRFAAAGAAGAVGAAAGDSRVITGG